MSEANLSPVIVPEEEENTAAPLFDERGMVAGSPTQPEPEKDTAGATLEDTETDASVTSLKNLRQKVQQTKTQEALQSGDITAIEMADVAKRREAAATKPDFATFIKNIQTTGTSADLGDIPITPEVVEGIQVNEQTGEITGDETLLLNLETMYDMEGFAPKEGEKIPFETASGKFDHATAKNYPELVPKLIQNFEGRKGIRRVLRQQDIPDNVNELITDNIDFSVGYQVAQRLAEAGRFTGTQIPDFLIMMMGVPNTPGMSPTTPTNPVIASIMNSGSMPGTDAFNAEYAVQSEKFRKNYFDFEGWVRSTIPAATLGSYYNEAIHNLLEEKYEGEEYENLAFERDITTGELLKDANGDNIKKQFVTEKTAYEINNITYNSLNRWEQFSTIIGEETLYGILTGGSSIVGGAAKIKELQRLKTVPKYKNVLRGVDDPEQIQQIVVQYDKRFKADRFFDAGLAQYRTNTELRTLNNRMNEITDQIDNLNARPEALSESVRLPSVTGTGEVELTKGQHLQRLDAELKQLRGVRNRAILSARVAPYLKDATETAGAIAVMTSVFKEFNIFGDPETDEAFGNLFASLGGYRPVLYGARNLRSKGAVAGASRISNKVAMPITMIRDTIARIPIVGELAVDTTVENINQFLRTTRNKDLTQLEKRHVRTIVEFYKKLKPEDRKAALQAQSETFDLVERFASRFKTPEMQSKARQRMLDVYEHTSGILSLVAAGQLNNSKSLDLKALSKHDIRDMEDNLRSQQNLITLAEDAIDELTGMAGGVDDVANREIIEGWVRSRQQGLDRIKEEINKTNTERKNNIDAMQDYVLNFGEYGLDDGTIASFLSYRNTLDNSLGEVLDKNNIVKSMNNSIDNRIDTALKAAKRIRNKTGHKASVNKLIETYVMGQDAKIRAAGDAIFDEPRRFANQLDSSGEPLVRLDIKPFIETFSKGRGIDGVKRFFGTESEVFFGRHGEKAREAFENILHANFSVTDFAEFRQQLLTKTTTNAQKDKIRSMDDLEIAIAMMEKNPNFNPFRTVDPMDMELIRRTFKRTASSYAKEGNKELAREFGSFVNKIDEYVTETNPEWAALIETARKKYEATVGVPTTSGLYLDNLYNKSERRLPASVVGKTGGMTLRNVYRDKWEPVQLFDEYSKSISELFMPGAKGRPADVQQLTDRLVYSFGKYKDGRYVFDVTTPEGQAHLEQFRDIMRETLISTIGTNTLEKYKKVKSKTRPTALAGQKGSEFLQDIDKTMEAMMIPVDYGGGKIVMEPVADMMDVVEASTSLSRAIKEQPLVAKAFGQLKDRFAEFKKTAVQELDASKERQLTALKNIEGLAGDLNAKDFVEKYIFSGEGGGVEMLKEAVQKTAIASGKDPAEAVSEFQKIISIYTIQGVYELAGVQAVGGKVIRGAGDEGRLVAKQIQSPEKALMALDNDATRRAVESAIGEDATLFLVDMLRVMNESTHVVRAATQTNDYKGISEAGVVSRLWNGIKGFVSPVYIATEYMLTAAKAGRISLMKLAVQDNEAAIILHKMISNPNLMTTQDFNKFEQIAENYVFTELAMQGQELILTDEEMPVVTAVKTMGPKVLKNVKEGSLEAVSKLQGAINEQEN